MSFSPSIQRTFLYALQEASRLGHAEVEECHLLLALIRADQDIKQLLESFGLPPARLRSQIASKMAGHQQRDIPVYSASLRATIRKAQSLAADALEPKHLLSSIIHQRQGLAFELLKTCGELARLELLLGAE
jgi:ATP-dependent Clp protease ATP-binding subunit ClpA